MTGTALVESLQGRAALATLAPDLDDLHAATDTPITGRRTWAAAWSDAYPTSTPWIIVVRDQESGRLDAAALLSRRDLSHVIDVAPLGFGRNDRSRLPARTPHAADELAAAIGAGLEDLAAPWTLRLEQVTSADAATAALAARLPVAAVLPGGEVPSVRFDHGGELDDYLSKALRKVLRKSRNRLDSDGRVPAYAWESSPVGVRAVIDDVERVHRERDHAVGRASDLDAEQGRRFWREVILRHAARGEVEIATLRIDGRLAAYVVSFLDGRSYRVFDGRCASEWSRYSPGRLLETATLGRVLADSRFAELDWMNSVAPEKLIAANAVEATEHLVACSPDLVLSPERASGGPALGDVAHLPTADLALRALAGVGRRPGRRAPGTAAPLTGTEN